jgi:hypothetical protein
MKQNNELSKSVADICANSCQEILSQVAKAKDAIVAQFRDLVSEHEYALQLALNEAEALAWQSEVPQLVFQDLAEEKARGVVSWIAHQRLVRSRSLLRA